MKTQRQSDNLSPKRGYIAGAGSTIDLFGAASYKQLKSSLNQADGVSLYWKNIGNYLSSSLKQSLKNKPL